MPKLAAIDVGTNSVLLTIVDATPEGRLEPVLERATITRLGQGVDRSRRLLETATERTLAALRGYAVDVHKHAPAAIRLVGTSALRDAEGAEPFLESVAALFGVELEVLSGAREAELTFRGALVGLAIQGQVLVADIGGGSTELILGRAAADERSAALSLDIGSVRLLERHLASDPPTLNEVAALRSQVRQELARVPFEPADASFVGVAGTVTTLAAMSRGMADYDGGAIHGSELTHGALAALLLRLLALPLSERRKLPGLPGGRADAIVAGGLILDELLAWSEKSALTVSDRGLRWGVLEELSRSATEIT